MKEVIHTDGAPKAIGPYSQGIKVGDFLFTAGQVCLNPVTGELNNSTLNEEVNQIMKNLSAIATTAGSSVENAVKTTIYVSDLADYGEINKIYGEYFPGNAPARSTVQVAALPLNVRVEIDMIIHIP